MLKALILSAAVTVEAISMDLFDSDDGNDGEQQVAPELRARRGNHGDPHMAWLPGDQQQQHVAMPPEPMPITAQEQDLALRGGGEQDGDGNVSDDVEEMAAAVDALGHGDGLQPLAGGMFHFKLLFFYFYHHVRTIRPIISFMFSTRISFQND